ncbi:MAG: phosphoglucosamine mutase [Phycisphaerales bacterium JB040]
MSDAPLILGVSGLRGIVGQSLTPEVAVRYAAAFGAWLRERTGSESPTVVVGRDGRKGGEAVCEAAVAGLLASGCYVTKLGVATTPTVGLVCGIEADAGIVVTASHNPAEWNGLKCLVCDEVPVDAEEDAFDSVARAPNAQEADEIISLFKGDFEYPTFTHDRAIETQSDAPYIHEFQCSFWMDNLLDQPIRDRFANDGSLGFTCVLDAVNCSGSTVAVPFLESLGIFIGLNCSNSGIFPHTPEPTRENLSGEGGLCDAVPGLKADIGFAQDPDADRLAIVDEKGEYIGEEYTLALCAMSILDAMGDDAKGSVLVANLSTSRMIDDVAAKYGARVERTPVGEANVVERMLALKHAGERVVLGGEGNGGVIWPEVVYVRDSLGSMALTLALMARTGKSVSQLVHDINALSAGGSGYAIVKRKVDIASKADAEPAVRAVSAWAKAIDGARTDTQDGVRVDFESGDWTGSWVHVRASNTEPIMRLICEAPTEATAAAVLTATEQAIAGN